MSMSWGSLIAGAAAYAVPMWLAGVGELVSERAGVINIGIEGMMLTGALAAWATTAATGSAWAGVLAAAVAGLAMALLFVLASLVFDADQVVAGTALNLLAAGATGMGFKLCIAAGLTDRRALFFEPVYFGQFWLFYATLAVIAAVHLILRHTRHGIEITALGEYPAAARAMGIRVSVRRAACVMFGGVTAGVAGSYLSIMFNTQFNLDITAGRGFLALAMVIFGRWQPVGLLGGGLFFGLVYWLGKSWEISAAGSSAVSLLGMLPYVLSLVMLAGFMGRGRAPAALGQPAER